jgi:hypothetical protein
LTEEREHNPDEELCGSRRTVQVGRMSAIDLTCMLMKWQHAEPLHFTRRVFGDVTMMARWEGSFEPSGKWDD